MIEFTNVSKTFNTQDTKIKALDNINLLVNKGDIYGVIGYSGAGKSTLIRTVNLLETPSSGEIFVEGQHLATLSQRKIRVARKKIGMIFQHFNLLHSKTIFDNVAMPLLLGGVSRAKIEKKVQETLAFVGLDDKIHHYPSQLSGGQKQRVGIARALVTDPTILLCDEATSALDPQTTVSILNLLKKINDAYDITILIITHEMEVIKEICNRVAVMENGKLIEAGKVIDVFTNPQTKTTESFVQSVVKTNVPQSILDEIKNDAYSGRVFQLRFLGKHSKKPMISQVSKKFNVDVNVLAGTITELQNIPFGNLIVEISGLEVEEAISFIAAEEIYIKEVN